MDGSYFIVACFCVSVVSALTMLMWAVASWKSFLRSVHSPSPLCREKTAMRPVPMNCVDGPFDGTVVYLLCERVPKQVLFERCTKQTVPSSLPSEASQAVYELYDLFLDSGKGSHYRYVGASVE